MEGTKTAGKDRQGGIMNLKLLSDQFTRSQRIHKIISKLEDARLNDDTIMVHDLQSNLIKLLMEE